MSAPLQLQEDGTSCKLQDLICSDTKDTVLAVHESEHIRLWNARGSSKQASTEGVKSVPDRHKCHIHLRPQPDPAIVASHVCSSRDGNYGVLAGQRAEDPRLLRVVVLDLHGKRSHLAERSPRQADCQATFVDEQSFAARPGLQIRQLAFHPGSCNHFLLLTSDDVLQLYDLHSTSRPEQRFELQLSPARSFGLSAQPQRSALAFSFGPGHDWLQFTVFILCSDGSIFAMCPVAPFGMAVPQAAAEHLAAEAEDTASSHSQSTTALWLRQAFAEPSFALTAADAASPEASSQHMQEACVRPHALGEHVPGLLGPLPVTRADSSPTDSDSDDASDLEDPACSLLVLGYGSACCLLATATASGRVSVHLLAAAAQPVWMPGYPQCITHAGSLAAVRSQVPLADAERWPLLLLDHIDLPGCNSASSADEDADSEAGSGATVVLLPDPAMPDRLLCCTASAAFSVAFPWLPILARHLSQDNPSWEAMARLPAPQITALHSRQPATAAGPFIAAAATGNALTGSAVAVLLADGSLEFLHRPVSKPAKVLSTPPSATQHDTPVSRISTPGSQALAASPMQQQQQDHSAAVEERISALYRDLLARPAQPKLEAKGSNMHSSTPEGQAYLSKGIAALRTAHVVYQHSAHLGLTQRLEELREAADEQATQLQEAVEVRDQVAISQEALTKQLQRCSDLQSNLHERVGILAELHWELPHALSAAELKLREVRLPRLEQLQQQLATDLEGMRKLAEKPQGQQQPLKAVQQASPLAASPSPVQMRRIRAGLGEQASMLASAQLALDRLEVQA